MHSLAPTTGFKIGLRPLAMNSPASIGKSTKSSALILALRSLLHGTPTNSKENLHAH